jgi:hypothetical protein
MFNGLYASLWTSRVSSWFLIRTRIRLSGLMPKATSRLSKSWVSWFPTKIRRHQKPGGFLLSGLDALDRKLRKRKKSWTLCPTGLTRSRSQNNFTSLLSMSPVALLQIENGELKFSTASRSEGVVALENTAVNHDDWKTSHPRQFDRWVDRSRPDTLIAIEHVSRQVNWQLDSWRFQAGPTWTSRWGFSQNHSFPPTWV